MKNLQQHFHISIAIQYKQKVAFGTEGQLQIKQEDRDSETEGEDMSEDG